MLAAPALKADQDDNRIHHHRKVASYRSSCSLFIQTMLIVVNLNRYVQCRILVARCRSVSSCSRPY